MTPFWTTVWAVIAAPFIFLLAVLAAVVVFHIVVEVLKAVWIAIVFMVREFRGIPG